MLVEKPEGKDHLKDLVVDGCIILKWILQEKGWKSVGRNHVAQDRVQTVLVNMVMYLQIP
jgi:hypothetical protein